MHYIQIKKRSQKVNLLQIGFGIIWGSTNGFGCCMLYWCFKFSFIRGAAAQCALIASDNGGDDDAHFCQWQVLSLTTACPPQEVVPYQTIVQLYARVMGLDPMCKALKNSCKNRVEMGRSSILCTCQGSPVNPIDHYKELWEAGLLPLSLNTTPLLPWNIWVKFSDWEPKALFRMQFWLIWTVFTALPTWWWASSSSIMIIRREFLGRQVLHL